jgi:hypothetical protein
MILTTWEAESGRIKVQANSGKKFARPHLNGKKLHGGVRLSFPVMVRRINRRIRVQASLGFSQKVRPYL